MFHSGSSGCSRALKVGSPPMVRVMPAAARRASARSPAPTSSCQMGSSYGVVGRGSWPRRPTVIENDTSLATTSLLPSMGAA